MHALHSSIVALSVALAALSAGAADIPIVGRKLIVKTEPASANRRFVFSSGKDSSIVAIADPTVGGATLFVAGLGCVGEDCASSGSSGSIPLPAAAWVGLGTPPGSKGYRYKDRDGTAGGIKKVVFKSGKIVIKGTGENWSWLPAGGEDGVALTWDVGGDRYCAEFGGTEKANVAGHLSFRNAGAPAACSALCGNDLLEGDEICDGSDSDACSGLCQDDCTCPTPVCGNEVIEGDEECDTLLSPPCWELTDFTQIGCTASCTCCIQTGALGCDFIDCCTAQYCWPTSGGTGGLCSDVPFPFPFE